MPRSESRSLVWSSSLSAAENTKTKVIRRHRTKQTRDSSENQTWRVTLFKIVKTKSHNTSRSWISSMMIWEYFDSAGSPCMYCNKIPVVQYNIEPRCRPIFLKSTIIIIIITIGTGTTRSVFSCGNGVWKDGGLQNISQDSNFSNRIWYPILSRPTVSARSSATRWATDMALIRLGCVHITLQTEPSKLVMALSRMNCATCVVFPHPTKASKSLLIMQPRNSRGYL